MVIQNTPKFSAPARLSNLQTPSLPTATAQQGPEDKIELNQQPPTPPENNWGPKLLGGVAGALVGIMAGHAGPAGVALAAGAGAAAVTLAAAGPLFKDSLENSQTGNLFQDVILTCGTLAAGSMLLATTSGAAAGLAYPLAAGLGSVVPLAAPVLGGVIGASVGSYFGIKN
jgi:hypothetical protein